MDKDEIIVSECTDNAVQDMPECYLRGLCYGCPAKNYCEYIKGSNQ